jgi:hypothetical protein
MGIDQQQTEETIQDISSKIVEVKIYNVDGDSSFYCSIENLKNIQNALIPTDIFKKYLIEAGFHAGPLSPPLYSKGNRLIILKLADNTERRISISYYGDSFKINGVKGYFVETKPDQRNWSEFKKVLFELTENFDNLLATCTE